VPAIGGTVLGSKLNCPESSWLLFRLGQTDWANETQMKPFRFCDETIFPFRFRDETIFTQTCLRSSSKVSGATYQRAPAQIN
jgi:hypothetical protein